MLELTTKMKDIIDFEKKYHSLMFSESSDELEKDLEADNFNKDVIDAFENENLLPDNYDYFELITLISDYANQ